MSGSSYLHEFVKSFPEELEEGILYVSVDFATAAHLCFCGCGREVYTPFSPRDWAMKFDGETVSLAPSVGNWSFDCQSHYILNRGRVRWAGRFSKDKIASVRELDRTNKERHYGRRQTQIETKELEPSREDVAANVFARIWAWMSGR